MAEETGAVKFVGRVNTTCGDVLGYEVTGEDGAEKGSDVTLLQPGDVISGVPVEEVKGFLLNANFQAEDQAAESAGEELEKEQQQQVAQARLSSGEVSAAVLAGIANDEEIEQALEETEEEPQSARVSPRRVHGRPKAAPETKEATGEGNKPSAGEENA